MRNVQEIEGTLKQRFIRRSFEFRSILVSVVWIAIEAVHYSGVGVPIGAKIAQVELDMWGIRLLCLVEIFLWVPYYALVRTTRVPENLVNLLTVLTDVIVLTGFIHFLGGIQSSFLPSLYLLLYRLFSLGHLLFHALRLVQALLYLPRPLIKHLGDRLVQDQRQQPQ